MGRTDKQVIDVVCYQSRRVVDMVVQMIRTGLLLLCNAVLHSCASPGKALLRAAVTHFVCCCLVALFLVATVIVAFPCKVHHGR